MSEAASSTQQKKHHANLCLRTGVSLCIRDEDGDKTTVFGDTLATLCQAVQDTGSLYAAAKTTGMSYSQAWKKIGFAEQTLGESLFIRRGNKGSSLSPTGEKLLSLYLSLNEGIAAKADALFCISENKAIHE